MSLANISTDAAIKKFNADIGVWTEKHASHIPIEKIQRKIALDVLRHAVMYSCTQACTPSCMHACLYACLHDFNVFSCGHIPASIHPRAAAFMHSLQEHGNA